MSILVNFSVWLQVYGERFMKDFAKVWRPCPWDPITRLRDMSTSSPPTKKQEFLRNYRSNVTNSIGVAAVPSTCPASIDTGAKATVLSPLESSFWPSHRA
jgi:hypothetical protein